MTSMRTASDSRRIDRSPVPWAILPAGTKPLSPGGPGSYACPALPVGAQSPGRSCPGPNPFRPEDRAPTRALPSRRSPVPWAILPGPNPFRPEDRAPTRVLPFLSGPSPLGDPARAEPLSPGGPGSYAALPSCRSPVPWAILPKLNPFRPEGRPFPTNGFHSRHQGTDTHGIRHRTVPTQKCGILPSIPRRRDEPRLEIAT